MRVVLSSCALAVVIAGALVIARAIVQRALALVHEYGIGGLFER